MKLLTIVLGLTLTALLLIPTAFADHGDNQVYSHSVLANAIDSTEVIDGGLGSEDYADGSIEAIHLNLVGDSVSTFATKTNVYSDSVVFGDTASIVVDHQVIGDSLSVTATNTKVYGTLTASGTVNATGDVNVSGDSLAVTATATKVYGTFYLADMGSASLADTGDSVQVAITGVDATPGDWFVILTPLGDWDTSPNCQTYWADTISVHSSAAEDLGTATFLWAFFKKAE